MTDSIARGLALSAVRVTTSHIFDTLAMMNSYFTLNPSEQKENTYALADSKLYRYDGVEWKNVTAVWKGDKGSTGDTGVSIVSVEDYDANTIRINLDDGTHYDVTKTEAEAKNITVDKTDFINRLQDFTGTNSQELMNYIDKIDEIPSGIFYYGKKNEDKSWKIIKDDIYLKFYRYDLYNNNYNLVAQFGSSVTSDRFILNDWAGSMCAVRDDGKYRTLLRPSIDTNGSVIGNSYGRVAFLHDGEMISLSPSTGNELTGELNDCTEVEGLANAKTLSSWSSLIVTSENRFYPGIKDMMLSSVAPGTKCRVWMETESGVIINESCTYVEFMNDMGTPVSIGSNNIEYKEEFPLLENVRLIIKVAFSNPVTMYGTQIDLGFGEGIQFVPMFKYVYKEATLENVATQEWIDENIKLTDSINTNSSEIGLSAKGGKTLADLISALSGGASPLVPISVEDFEILQSGFNGQHYIFTNEGNLNGAMIRQRDHCYIVNNFDYEGTDPAEYIQPTDYIVMESETVGSSGVFITNIEPMTSGKAVSKTMEESPNEETIKSVVSDDSSWRVTVVWDRNANSWTGGIPTVNGHDITNIAHLGSVTFSGNAIIETSDITNDTITAALGEISYNVPITFETPPTITSVTFGDYPTGQTSVKENDTVLMSVTADLPFTKITLFNYELAKAETFTFPEGTTETVNITCASRGLTTATAQHVKVTVSSPTGSTSAEYISTNEMLMNNSVPSLTVGAITYPATQEALKDTEEATVNFTTDNCDVVTPTSPNGELTIGTLTETSLTVTRLSGDYNVSTNNLSFLLKLNENGATATVDTLVNIVNVAAICTDVDAVYCQSPNTTTISTNFDQLVKITSVSLPKGTLSSPTTTSTYSDSYSLEVQAAHTDDHSNNVLDASIEVSGMSGISATVNRPYGIRGFAETTITVPYPSNIAVLPTTIINTANVTMLAYIDTVPRYEIGGARVNSSAVIENVGQSYWYSGATQIEFASVDKLVYFGYTTGQNIIVTISESE